MSSFRGNRPDRLLDVERGLGAVLEFGGFADVARAFIPAFERSVRIARTADDGGGYPTSGHVVPIIFEDGSFPSTGPASYADRQSAAKEYVADLGGQLIPEGTRIPVFNVADQWWTRYSMAGTVLATRFVLESFAISDSNDHQIQINSGAGAGITGNTTTDEFEFDTGGKYLIHISLSLSQGSGSVTLPIEPHTFELRWQTDVGSGFANRQTWNVTAQATGSGSSSWVYGIHFPLNPTWIEPSLNSGDKGRLMISRQEAHGTANTFDVSAPYVIFERISD